MNISDILNGQNELHTNLCLLQQSNGGERGKRRDGDQELIISDNLLLNQVPGYEWLDMDIKIYEWICDNLYILKQTSGIMIMRWYLGGRELRYMNHDSWHLIMALYSGGGEVRFAWSSDTWPGRRRRAVHAVHRLVQNPCCSNFWFDTLVQLSTGRSWSFNWPVALCIQTFTWLSRRL